MTIVHIYTSAPHIRIYIDRIAIDFSLFNWHYGVFVDYGIYCA